MTTFIQPPEDHMKILAVDPGTTRSGALFVSIPGPGENVDRATYRPTRVHFYGEYMGYNQTARDFAREIKAREGETMFYEVVIDWSAGRQTPMGFDHTVCRQYEDAFREAGIETIKGFSFEKGSRDVDGRELLLKEWMRGADPILRVHPHLANLKTQMEDFFKRRDDPTKRENKKITELIHAAEYVAAYFDRGLFWYPPKKIQAATPKDEAVEVLRDLRASNWDIKQAHVRAKIRHHGQMLLVCSVETEDEVPGEPGDQMWWPQDQAVPQGWEVLDKNDQTRNQKWAALSFLRERNGPVF